jgi:hypothetical protein
MKSRATVLIACAILAAASFIACSPAAGGDPKSVKITGVGFSIANHPTDWYSSSSTNKPNLVYDFTLWLDGSFSVGDIEYARIYLPSGSTNYWSLNAASGFDPATKGLSAGIFYSGRTVGSVTEAGRGVELPVGTMKAVVRLTNGVSSSSDITMGVPGSASAGAMSFVFNPDDEAAAAEPSITAPALRRPTATFSGGGFLPLTVNFTVHGNNVHNGWVWFYSSSGYVGIFYPFRAESNGAVSAKVNGGVFNASDGGINTVSINSADILNNDVPISSAAFSSISRCRVVVCDGAQYEAPDRWAWYDYKAVSTLTLLAN